MYHLFYYSESREYWKQQITNHKYMYISFIVGESREYWKQLSTNNDIS